MFAGPPRGALADVTTLGENIASGPVLTRLPYARIQRLLAISTRELRRADASVIGRLVFLNRVISMLVTVLVIDLVIVIALGRGATFPRVLLRPAFTIDQGAMSPLAPHDVHPALAPPLAPFLDPPALVPVAQVLLEDRLAGGTVLAREIGARVLPALLHAIRLQDLFVAAHVEIHVDSIDLQLSYATEETVVGPDILVNPVQTFSTRFVITLGKNFYSRSLTWSNWWAYSRRTCLDSDPRILTFLDSARPRPPRR